ncbi:MAG: hypothetical protein HY617_00965 [Candidatus Sungbacteria bacterium]|nr:hypothetical protein [Candidatus Sungbacteria bacterium]
MMNLRAYRKKIAARLPEPLLEAYVGIKKKLRRIPPHERVKFNPRSIFKGHLRVTYRGIPAIRCPFDYVLYQMLIFDVKPDLIIDIGTNMGGGTLYMADLLNAIGHGTIHTIDLIAQADPIIKSHPRIQTFIGGWQNYDLAQANGFKKILVIEDGSHMYEDSIGALRKFSPLVSIGSYYIVEDSIVSELADKKTVMRNYHGGPLRAIREFLASTDAFEIDKTYCNMFGLNATFNINGYLKKLK